MSTYTAANPYPPIKEEVTHLLGMIPGTEFYRPDGLEAMVFVEGDIVNFSLTDDGVVHSQHMTMNEYNDETGWQTGYPDI